MQATNELEGNIMGRNIVLLDGGMGQELQARSDVKPTPLWSAQFLLDKPDIVEGVHRDFVEAGAKVLTLSSYSVTPERLARDGDIADFEPMQERALDIAERAVCGNNTVTVAGCLPPMIASYRPDLAPAFDQCVATYQQIVDAQKERVDVFICETMSSIKEARASLKAAKTSDKPVWVALSVDDKNPTNLRSGEKLSEALLAMEQDKADAVVINCSTPEAIDQAMEILAEGILPFGAYANGFTKIDALQPGGTVDALTARQDLTPQAYADFVMGWVEKGATIVGGCCEVGPKHISEINDRLKAAGHSVTGKL